MSSTVDAPSPSSGVKRDPGGDLDPADFLASIRELTRRREEEDLERYRKLQEEVEKSRAERHRRKTERAFSISPTKPASAGNPLVQRSPITADALSTPPSLIATESETGSMADDTSTTQPPSPTKDIPEFKGFGSARNSGTSTDTHGERDATSATQTTPHSASSLARSGTLTWQRRPVSRSGSRPVSVVGTWNSSSVKESAREATTEPTRDEIAASLASRDPTWFRQTADRGVGSAAYRKSKDVEDTRDHSLPSARRGLPGLSRETTAEADGVGSPVPSESVKSETTSRPTSFRDSGLTSSRLSTATSASTPSKPDLQSLIAADESQSRASPMSDNTSSIGGDSTTGGRTLTMSSTQARLADSIERPSSPTKGSGGFVQSAMMKRTESVSKRWSAQSGASPSRQSSVASARSGYRGLQSSYSMPKLQPTADSEGDGDRSTTIPTASSSNDLPATAAQDKVDFVKPALPSHSRSRSTVSHNEDGASSPPGSPSKRWSPTKSSWIESALIRPETPKPAPSQRNSQPSWMANIAKAKAEKASADSTSRLGTPAQVADGERPGSPTKSTPFGPAMLKRSESRGRSQQPKEVAPSDNKPRTLLSRTERSEPAAAPSVVEEMPTSLPDALEHADPTKGPHSQETRKSAEEAADGESAEPDRQAANKDANPAAPTELQRPQKLAQPKPETSAGQSSTPAKPKPEVSSKPQTDFRSTLRSRPVTDSKASETPEFLSKFGNLRKTQPEKYVVEDVLKNNILRGKADLTKTGGPVKTQRRDELKESLLAKKEDWRKAKEEGRELPGAAHERKVSGAPVTPSKPEALAKRDLLGRPDSSRTTAINERAREATPEALARHKSLKDKPKPELPGLKKEATFPDTERMESEQLTKQRSAPAVIEHPAPVETSKLAARFNPGLAGMLARGPPKSADTSNVPSRSGSPALPMRTATPSAEVQLEPAASAPLQDMRKSRAKGPKRGKAGGGEPAKVADKTPSTEVKPLNESFVVEEGQADFPAITEKPKPRAPPGSAASIMIQSLQERENSSNKANKPTTPAKPRVIATETSTPITPARSIVPDFAGFRSTSQSTPALKADEDKENASVESSSVKATPSRSSDRAVAFERHPTSSRIDVPKPTNETAADKANGLGISIQNSKASSATPPASTALPPRPAKSSRVVSGQLQEANPNQSLLGVAPGLQSEDGDEISHLFNSLPPTSPALTIDVGTTVATVSADQSRHGLRTLRKTIHEVRLDGTVVALRSQEEYTLFDEEVYVCSHSFSDSGGARKSETFVWKGNDASETSLTSAQAVAKKSARESGSSPAVLVRQGYESSVLLQALGGILITRRGAREGAPKQFMLCGRRHSGHIAFDEVDFDVRSLCSGFVYLISYPVTPLHTKLYLWKGSACSTEEIGAARLAGMDINETGELIEVDDDAEFPSFLKIFGPDTTKTSIPTPVELWQHKSVNPNNFAVRLFRIQQIESKPSYFSTFFRRPSWQSRSPSPSPHPSPTRERTTAPPTEPLKVEAKLISPFTQSDMEPEGLYVLDAYCQLYLLIGPLFPSSHQSDSVRMAILQQALAFIAEYSRAVTEVEGRQRLLPPCGFWGGGVPEEVKRLFRYWDEGRGLFGTGGLMAGSSGWVGGSGEVRRIVW